MTAGDFRAVLINRDMAFSEADDIMRGMKSPPRRTKRHKSGDGEPARKQLGLRERNKLAKEEAIRSAAHDLFLKNGYEATTLRQVADAADVGFGTVLAYSKDKAGLLAMIFVEQLRSLPPLFDDVDESQSLEGMLLAALSHLYRFWASVPTLNSHVLEQMEFYSGNPHMDRIIARRAEARAELTAWVERMQRAGRVSNDIDADEAAGSLFAIYTSAVREWAAEGQDLAMGLNRLSRLLALPIRGLSIEGPTLR